MVRARVCVCVSARHFLRYLFSLGCWSLMMVNGYLLMCESASSIFGAVLRLTSVRCSPFPVFIFRLCWRRMCLLSLFPAWIATVSRSLRCRAGFQQLLTFFSRNSLTSFISSWTAHFSHANMCCDEHIWQKLVMEFCSNDPIATCVCALDFIFRFTMSGQRQRFSWVFMRWQLVVSVSHSLRCARVLSFIFFFSFTCFRRRHFNQENLYGTICAGAAAAVGVAVVDAVAEHICFQSARSPAYTHTHTATTFWSVLAEEFLFSPKKVFAGVAVKCLVVCSHQIRANSIKTRQKQSTQKHTAISLLSAAAADSNTQFVLVDSIRSVSLSTNWALCSCDASTMKSIHGRFCPTPRPLPRPRRFSLPVCVCVSN